MRKLKLQVQTSIDGFIGRPDGALDWMQWNWDDELKNYVDQLHTTVDCILLGRKMSEGFLPAWEERLTDPESAGFARKMVDTRKIIFSKQGNKPEGKNTELASGNSADFIKHLKEEPGNDIIVYGGSSFVSSLIKDGLIDEYNIFVNPSAIGKGLPIFHEAGDKFELKLVDAKPFECGVTLLKYKPVH
ncbi:MAG: dihydrofolate reductase family protein [Ignavibacteriaceae bacterium]